MTTSVVQYQRNSGGVDGVVDRESVLKVVEHRNNNATSPQVINVLGVTTIQAVRNVQIINTSGVRRWPSGAVSFSASGNTVSVTDGTMASTDVITFDVVGYN